MKGGLIMSKIINLDEFKERKHIKCKLNTLEITKKEKIEARNYILYDDDKYILDMLLEEDLQMK